MSRKDHVVCKEMFSKIRIIRTRLCEDRKGHVNMYLSEVEKERTDLTLIINLSIYKIHTIVANV